jgi:hypothetical protein
MPTIKGILGITARNGMTLHHCGLFSANRFELSTFLQIHKFAVSRLRFVQRSCPSSRLGLDPRLRSCHAAACSSPSSEMNDGSRLVVPEGATGSEASDRGGSTEGPELDRRREAGELTRRHGVAPIPAN